MTFTIFISHFCTHVNSNLVESNKLIGLPPAFFTGEISPKSEIKNQKLENEVYFKVFNHQK
jgi:hypothetical protein